MVYRRRKRSSTAANLFAGAAILATSGGLLYWLVADFRASQQAVLAEEELTTESLPEPAAPTWPADLTVGLRSSFDGAKTGSASRLATATGARWSMTLFLPALDQAVEQYDVWFVRKGLSDVRYAGALSPRADGTWFLQADTSPETGYRDPNNYAEVKIMRAERGQPAQPRGQTYVEGSLASP